MGPEGAVNVVFRQEIARTLRIQKLAQTDLIQHYREDLANPYVAASRGYLDDVIDYAESRDRLITALEILRDKRQTVCQTQAREYPLMKNGNIESEGR